MDEFLWNLIFETFFENLSRKFKLYYNLTGITGTLHEDICTFMTSHWNLLTMRNFSRKSRREKQNTFYVLYYFCPKIARFTWKNKVEPERPQMTIKYGAYALHAGWIGYRHTLRISHSYCLSTATVVRWRSLNMTLYVRYISCHNLSSMKYLTALARTLESALISDKDYGTNP